MGFRVAENVDLGKWENSTANGLTNFCMPTIPLKQAKISFIRPRNTKSYGSGAMGARKHRAKTGSESFLSKKRMKI